MGSLALTVHPGTGVATFFSGIGTGVAVPMVGWEAGGMVAVLYQLFWSKWGRTIRWDGTWWDGSTYLTVGFPSHSHPIPY